MQADAASADESQGTIAELNEERSGQIEAAGPACPHVGKKPWQRIRLRKHGNVTE